jgi:hypothetical protein
MNWMEGLLIFITVVVIVMFIWAIKLGYIFTKDATTSRPSIGDINKKIRDDLKKIRQNKK